MHRRTQLCIVVVLMALAAGSLAAQPQPGGPGGAPPPGGFGHQPFAPPPMMGMPPANPELAKKMAAIAALREIHNLRISAAEIGKALPLLKELREAEKTLEAQAGEALEQEKRALLAARPDTQVPPASAERLRAANERYHQQSQRIWESLHKEVGPHIAGGLHRILSGGMGFGPMFGPGMQPPAGFGGGPGFGPGGVRPGVTPPGGDDRPGTPGQPGPGELGPPPGPGFQPGAPGRFAPQPPPGQGRPGGRGVGQVPQRPGAPGQPGRGQNQDPRFSGPGGTPGPGRPMMPGPGGGMGWQPFSPAPRISLAELIDLLEQKRAAMGR